MKSLSNPQAFDSWYITKKIDIEKVIPNVDLTTGIFMEELAQEAFQQGYDRHLLDVMECFEDFESEDDYNDYWNG